MGHSGSQLNLKDAQNLLTCHVGSGRWLEMLLYSRVHGVFVAPFAGVAFSGSAGAVQKRS